MELKLKLKEWMPNKHMILIKILLFMFNGATHSLVPYLAVHMKQIGISVNETAIIHAILPVAMFVGPPVSGYIGDKFGCYRVLLFVSLIMTGALHTALLWVPEVRSGAVLDNAELSCTRHDQRVNITFDIPSEDCSIYEKTTVEFTDCRSQCPNPYAYLVKNEQQRNNGDVALCGEQDGRSTCMSYDSVNRKYLIIINAINATDPFSKNHVFNVKDESSPELNSSTICPSMLRHNCTLMCARPPSINKLWMKECGDRQLTFWLYLIIRIHASIFMSSCYVLLDSITLHLIEENDTDYGKQRLWSVLATAVFPPIAGFLVDYVSVNEDYPNYAPTFYVQDVLLVMTALTSILLTVKIKLSSETNLKTVYRLIKTPRADVLFVALFVLGTMWGFVEVFLYWYLLDLNSPKYLLGLTLTVGSGIGVPVLFFAENIIAKVGHVNVVFTAFMFYCIRYIGYSFIYNPWWCLAFEAMEIFTLHVLWVAAVKYSTFLAPKALLATMQGAIGGTHYGFGRGSGSLIGGLLMGHFGARDTFRFMGTSAAIAGVIYLGVEKIFFRKPLVVKEDLDNDKEKKTADKNLELTANPKSTLEARQTDGKNNEA